MWDRAVRVSDTHPFASATGIQERADFGFNRFGLELAWDVVPKHTHFRHNYSLNSTENTPLNDELTTTDISAKPFAVPGPAISIFV